VADVEELVDGLVELELSEPFEEDVEFEDGLVLLWFEL
jgi:hypothetical protein